MSHIAQRGYGVRMALSQCLLPYLQASLIQRLGLRILALGLVQVQPNCSETAPHRDGPCRGPSHLFPGFAYTASLPQNTCPGTGTVRPDYSERSPHRDGPCRGPSHLFPGFAYTASLPQNTCLGTGYSKARLFREVATSGWSLPRAFSRISRLLLNSGSASVYLPWYL